MTQRSHGQFEALQSLLASAWHRPVFDFLNEHQAWLWWMGAASLGMMIVAALLLPWLICRLPEDYFTEAYVQQRKGKRKAHWSWAVTILFFRNVLAVVLIVAGVAMLFLPGQGVLTILIGLLLLTLPGKRSAVKWIACRRGVCGPLNWMRRRRGHAEFLDLERPSQRAGTKTYDDQAVSPPPLPPQEESGRA